MKLLKDANVKNKRGLAKNYLRDKTIYYEKPKARSQERKIGILMPEPNHYKSKSSTELRQGFKGSKAPIKNFFQNLAACKSKTPKNANISFGLLMGNFRRKKILETLKSGKLNHQEKNQVLTSYDEYIKAYYGE